MTRPFAFSVTVLMLAGSASMASAQTRVLPPGLEDEVARMVFADGQELDGGRVTGARIEQRYVEVELEAGAARGRVRLVERGTPSEGRRVGDTPSFSLFVLGDDPALIRVARALRTRVAERDDGRFFAERTIEVSGAPEPNAASPAVLAMRAVRAALWLALLLIVAVVLRRSRGDLGRADVRAGLVLFVAALALRLALPPWAPIHANDHGISEMRGFLGFPGPHEAALYGFAYLDLVRVLSLFGDWIEGPLLIGAVAGALAPVMLFALARNLAPSHRFGAIAAGIALAIHPIHVRLSLSECPRALAGTLWLLGLALAAFAFRDSRARTMAWLGAAIAWALAAELRVITLLLPIAGLLFVVLALGHWRGRPSLGALVVGAAIVLGVTLVHRHTLRGAFSAASERSFEVDALVWRGLDPSSSVLFDPTLTAWLFLPLAAFGALRLAAGREWRLLAAVACTFALLLPPSLLVWASRTDAIRYQSEAHFPLMLLLLGLPAPRLDAWRGALSILAPAALIVSATPGWMDAARPDVHAQAYAIAIERAPATPIRVAPREMAGDSRVRSDFPDYAVASEVSTEMREGCHVWIGVSCWSFTDEEVERGSMNVHFERGAPFRMECAEMLGGVAAAREALRSLAPIDVPHREEEFHRIPAPRPRVGYAPCPVGSSQGAASDTADSNPAMLPAR